MRVGLIAAAARAIVATLLMLAVAESGAAQSQDSPLPVTTPDPPQFQLTTAQSPRQRPTREASRGQSLTLTGNVLRGYDDNAGATPGFGGGAVPVVLTNGSTGYADVMLEYLRKTRRRSLLFRALGDLTSYPDYLERPAPGAKVRFVGVTPVGRSNSLTVSAQARYEPLFTPTLNVDTAMPALGTPADVTTPIAPGAQSPTTGLFERQSWVTSSKAYLTTEWSPRDTTVLSYLYFTNRYSDHSANDYQQANIEYGRRINHRIDLNANYAHMSGRYTNAGDIPRPTTQDTLAGGPALTTRLRGRQLSLALRGGSTFVEAIDTVTGQPYHGWKPYASASATFDLTNAWRLAGDYGRNYSVLPGLTSQVYAADASTITLYGRVARRAYVTTGARFANGQTLVASGLDTFNLYGGIVEVHVTLTSRLAATSRYVVYHQRYSNPAALPTGFPARYDRNAFQIGLTFWSRLAGSLPARPRGAGDW